MEMAIAIDMIERTRAESQRQCQWLRSSYGIELSTHALVNITT